MTALAALARLAALAALAKKLQKCAIMSLFPCQKMLLWPRKVTKNSKQVLWVDMKHLIEKKQGIYWMQDSGCWMGRTGFGDSVWGMSFHSVQDGNAGCWIWEMRRKIFNQLSGSIGVIFVEINAAIQ